LHPRFLTISEQEKTMVTAYLVQGDAEHQKFFKKFEEAIKQKNADNWC